MASGKIRKASLWIKLSLVGVFVILVLVSSAIAKQTYKKNQIQKEITKLQEKAAELNRENLEIRDKISYLESREYQEKEAKDKLNLQNPGENIVIIKPSVVKDEKPPQESRIVVAKEPAKISNPIKWWNYFFKY